MPNSENQPTTEATEDNKPTPQDNLVTTHHNLAIGGETIAYTVTAGTIVLKEEAEKKGEEEGASEGEKPKASIFFIAYTRDDVPDPASRPLTFSFNGGPGSSSVWLHLGRAGAAAGAAGRRRLRACGRPTTWWTTRPRCWT